MAHLDLFDVGVFLAVARERSFSKAAARVHRTQPAVSQAVRRLEEAVGESLVDRSTRDGRLTAAGRVLQDFGERLVRLADEAHHAVRGLRDLSRGRVLIGSNEGGVHILLPVLAAFQAQHPDVQVDVRRVSARQIASEVAEGSLDFGILTFRPAQPGLSEVPLGHDELVLLVPPAHRLARRAQVDLRQLEGETIVAHNDPSPARERVLRIFDERNARVRIQVSLPSLDAIKRAVELGIGVALLPRRCALAEIERGQLAAVRVSGLRLPRRIRLVFRRGAPLSHAAQAFLGVVQANRG